MRASLLLSVPLVILACAASAFAQGGPPRQRVYSPSPKFSPYLFLSRGSVGGVPAYYAWVRPRIEYDQRVRTVDNELKMLEVQQNAGPLNEVPDGRGKPSTASHFMTFQHQSYSHFYPDRKVPPQQQR
jgi:hypothetical protein